MCVLLTRYVRVDDRLHCNNSVEIDCVVQLEFVLVMVSLPLYNEMSRQVHNDPSNNQHNSNKTQLHNDMSYDCNRLRTNNERSISSKEVHKLTVFLNEIIARYTISPFNMSYCIIIGDRISIPIDFIHIQLIRIACCWKMWFFLTMDAKLMTATTSNMINTRTNYLNNIGT